MRISRPAAVSYTLTVLYATFIFYLSSRSSLQGTGLDTFPHSRVAHVVQYTILGFLLYLSLHHSSVDHPLLRQVTATKMGRDSVLAMVTGTLYGVSDEVHQYFVPGRTMDPLDVLADSAGVAMGILLAIRFLDMRRVRGSIIGGGSRDWGKEARDGGKGGKDGGKGRSKDGRKEARDGGKEGSKDGGKEGSKDGGRGEDRPGSGLGAGGDSPHPAPNRGLEWQPEDHHGH